MIDVKEQIKRERRLLSAAKSRLKKVIADNLERRTKGNLKKNEGLRLTMSEISAEKNVKYHENALAELLKEVAE